jgi:hypothetical protein
MVVFALTVRRAWETEDGRQRTEDREQRPEDRGQKLEGRRRRTEGQRSEIPASFHGLFFVSVFPNSDI